MECKLLNSQLLQELSDEDLRSHNGGFWGAAIFFVVSTFVVAAIDSPDDFWEGYNSVRNK